MAQEPEKPPLPIVPMAVHATIAAVVFYSLNRFVLGQPLETSLVWGAVSAPFAAYVAYTQARR